MMIRWGVLGAGKIASRFASSLENETGSSLYAIAARKEEKALAFLGEHKADRYYLSYDAFLEDENIDAIYLALPHALHKDWAIKALHHKKAVLCEKPAGLNQDEVKCIADAASWNQTLFMEAMKSRFVPIFKDIISIIDSGKIGTIRRIDTVLCFNADLSKATYHTQVGQGGALYDSGIYCANFIDRFTTGTPVLADIETRIENGIDLHVKSELQIGPINASLEVAFDENKAKTCTIEGKKGKILIYDLHRPQKIEVITDDESKIIEKPYLIDDFYTEILHFTDLMRNGMIESPIMPISDSFRCAQILDIIRNGFKKFASTRVDSV